MGKYVRDTRNVDQLWLYLNSQNAAVEGLGKADGIHP